ncbi:hypothetical protein LTR01_007902 [Friedmanniomyces endolithicus]|nr:hypothetical protein LTR01_007902 [Friedmanniomyces endolithicus]KAK0829422.1 hypothetical protein LTR73_004366 [Friedmanniomyces endolithicus]
MSDIFSNAVVVLSPSATPKSAARVPCLSPTRTNINRVHKSAAPTRLDARSASSIPHTPPKPPFPETSKPRVARSPAYLGPTNPTTLEDSSSDEWTGDEDFMPRSARRRHRQERLRVKAEQQKGQLCRSPPSPASIPRLLPTPTGSPLSVSFRERLAALRSPGASRCQRRVVLVQDAGTRLQTSGETMMVRGCAGSVVVRDVATPNQSAFSASSDGGSGEDSGCESP